MSTTRAKRLAFVAQQLRSIRESLILLTGSPRSADAMMVLDIEPAVTELARLANRPRSSASTVRRWATTNCGIAEFHAPGMHPPAIDLEPDEEEEPDEDERSNPYDSIAPGILLELDRKNGRPKSKGTKEIRHEIIEEESNEA